MIKYQTQMGKDLFSELEENGLLEYGSVIMGTLVRNVIGLKYPETATRKEFQDLALVELACTDYVRNILLGQGKYLGGSGGDYRVLLPSENAKQCESYISSATKKLNRSLKLSRNTPKGDHPSLDNLSVRALMKKESVRDSR